MNSYAVPWHVLPDNHPTTSPRQFEFIHRNMHLNPTPPLQLSQEHGTTMATSPPEALLYYEPQMTPYISGVPSFVGTLPLATMVRIGENDKKKQKKKFKCEICQKTFMRPSALKVHVRIHNGEKPFQCTYCPRSFSQSGNLTVHLRMHTGEKPFTCPVCFKAFSQSNTLKVHIRSHMHSRVCFATPASQTSLWWLKSFNIISNYAILVTDKPRVN